MPRNRQAIENCCLESGQLPIAALSGLQSMGDLPPQYRAVPPSMTILLHPDGTVSRTGRCDGCLKTFEVGLKTHIQQRWCSNACRKKYRRREIAEKAAPLPLGELYARDFDQPLKEGYEACCLPSGHTTGLWWYTPVEARLRALAGLPRCGVCGGACFLQTAYGRSRAAV